MTSLLATMRKDILRYIPPARREMGVSALHLVAVAAAENSLWLVLLYRIGRWIRTEVRNPVLRFLLKIPYAFVSRPVNFLHDTHISLDAEIGEGLYLGHYGGIWIGPTRMGSHCNLSHDVTIGKGGKGENRGIPVFGDRVYLAPGSKVFGQITIGSDVAIGANAVVSRSFPDKAVVVGNPARVVGNDGSSEQIEVGRLRR